MIFFKVFVTLLLGIFGLSFDDHDEPVRLGKVNDEDTLMCKIEAWMLRHTSFCLLVLFVVLSLLFALLCFVLVGVSATDSGITYNHFKDVI